MVPFVSVIIPNYNHAPYLQARIESVLNQSFQDFEMILMDDCSSDESKDILESFREQPKCRDIVYNSQNSGSTFLQWNKGVSLANGKYIWIAESDDLADSNLLERLVAPILQDDNIVLSYANSMKIDSEGKPFGLWSYKRKLATNKAFEKDFVSSGKDYILSHLIYQNTLPNASGILLKKATYLQVGGADASVEKCGDWYLWLKMALEGDVAYCKDPLNYFRFHTSSVIGNSMKALRKGAFLNFYDLKLRDKFNAYLDAQDGDNTAIKQENERQIGKELREDLWYFIKKRRLDNALATIKKMRARV